MAPRRATAAATTVAAALTVSSGAVATGTAAAAFGPGGVPVSATNCALAAPGSAELGSSGSQSPAISDDGRYVVFWTSASNLLGRPAQPDQYHSGGLMRCDTTTGALALVAPPGRKRDDGDGNRANDVVVAADPALNASVSADGRRIAFATPQALLDTDRNTASDVYVRDMTRPLSDPATAYELASSIDARDRAPAYTSEPGSAVYPNALSNDGRRVAFVTRAVSNVLDGGAVTTPANQILVRDLDRRSTTLVTRRRADGGPITGTERPLTVALSGNGAVVVWTGGDASEQTPFLQGEDEAETHMLWRTVGDPGPARRITGASDLDDPECDRTALFDPGAVGRMGPCYGPLRLVETFDSPGHYNASMFGGPSVSDDGQTVVYTSSAGIRSRTDVTDIRSHELFVADMRPGVTRKAGTRLLLTYPAGGGIDTAALSGDGRHIAIRTSQTIFPGLRPVGDIPLSPGGNPANAYLIDLAAESVERITRSPAGSDVRTGVGLVAPSADGSAVALQTEDNNLFAGDGNDMHDIVLVRRAPAPPPPVPPVLPPTLGGAGLAEIARPVTSPPARFPIFGALRVNKDLSVSLRVRVPAAGTLSASAKATRRKKKVAVGSARLRPRRASSVTIRVPAGRRARALLRRRPYTLKVQLSVTFKPARGAATKVTRTYTLAGSQARAAGSGS